VLSEGFVHSGAPRALFYVQGRRRRRRRRRNPLI